MKDNVYSIFSKLCNLLAYGWIIIIVIERLFFVFKEISKEPSFWHSIKRLRSMMDPLDLSHDMRFWTFLFLLIPAFALLQLSKYLQDKSINKK